MMRAFTLGLVVGAAACFAALAASARSVRDDEAERAWEDVRGVCS